ncbi:MAG: hypothetical protein J5809_08050 [Selenomonadaceae bacterium]|nr:hypothetical protein [Selenomonadaceae bacterium]
MKKKILSALTATLILGVVSPTFAAPIDDEVAELRARLAQLERRIAERDARIEYESERVDDLERGVNRHTNQTNWAEKFKVNGELRYRFWNMNRRDDVSQLQLRILPSVQINENFAVKTRFTASYNMNSDTESDWRANFAYLEGKFNRFQINAGKLPLFTEADGGMVADDFFSGVQAIVDVGDTAKLRGNVGHWDEKGDYLGAEVTVNPNENLDFGVGYHHFRRNKDNIVAGGVGYQLNDDWKLNAAVAYNNKANSHKTAYNLEANYHGANRKEVGSWGAYAAYRYVGSGVGIVPTYDTYGQTANKRGFEIGAGYTPFTDTLLKVSYFHGKSFDAGHPTDRTFFARASLFF